jgi:hypothetical protein
MAVKEGGRTLIVWRHGQTDHNASGIWQGQLDTPLSDKGREQALTAAGALAAYNPSVIVSSDLQRAADTARALGSRIGVQVRYDERLREVHAGLWQGMTAGDVAEQFPVEQAALMAGEDIPRGVHGESMGQVAARTRAAVEDVVWRVVRSWRGWSDWTNTQPGSPLRGFTTAIGPSCTNTPEPGGSLHGTSGRNLCECSDLVNSGGCPINSPGPLHGGANTSNRAGLWRSW